MTLLHTLFIQKQQQENFKKEIFKVVELESVLEGKLIKFCLIIIE